MQDMEEFDNEKFISEVQARPVLWDCRVDEYLNRQNRIKAWREMCFKFVPHFGDKSSQGKNIAAKRLQRKWKSFRDCFIREHKKQIRSRGTERTPRRKPYRYYQNLSFLINVISNNKSSQCESEENNSSNLSMRERQKTSLNNEIGNTENERTHVFPESPATSQSKVDEADRNFVLSLLPHFKHILDECKLDAQMEILMVLKKYKSLERHDSVLASHPSRSSSPDDCQVLSDDASITVSEDVKSLYY